MIDRVIQVFSSVAEHGAGNAGLPDFAAKLVGLGACIAADAGGITRARTEIAASLPHDQSSFGIKRPG